MNFAAFKNHIPENYHGFYDGQFNLDIPLPEIKKSFLEELETQFNSQKITGFQKENATLIAKELAWDTDFFGFPVYKFEHLFSTDITSAVLLVKQHLNYLKTKNVRYIFARVKSDDLLSQEALYRNEFSLMLHKVMLRYKISEKSSYFENNLNENFQVLPYEPAFQSEVLDIASASITTSRFTLDALIDPVKAAAVYRNWAESLIETQPESISIALYNDRPIGMVAATDANTLYGSAKFPDTQMGFISLVAVKKGFANKGWGQALIQHALSKFAAEGKKAVFANTALQNTGSLAMFQKSGFQVFSMVTEYRRWL